MKKHRYKVSFSLTTLLYASIVVLYFYILKQQIVVSDSPKENAIELALSQFVPEASPAIDSEPVPKEEVLEEKIEPEPEPPEKPKIEEEPIPEPVVKEVPAVEPVKKIIKKIKKKTVKKKKKKVRKKRQIRSGGSPHHSAAQKNRFLSQIRTRINRAKSYPRIAQRRGMQGIIKASFTILPNGKVGNISLLGPKVFHTSAKKAIKSAFPVNVAKAPVSLPTTVTLTLRYKLR